MKKIILFCGGIMLLTQANAQIVLDNRGNNFSINSYMPMIRYNAAIIGHAQACKFDSNDIARVNNALIKKLEQTKPTQEQAIELQNLLNNTIAEFKNKGSANTPVECQIYKKEFDKIVEIVKKQN